MNTKAIFLHSGQYFRSRSFIKPLQAIKTMNELTDLHPLLYAHWDNLKILSELPDFRVIRAKILDQLHTEQLEQERTYVRIAHLNFMHKMTINPKIKDVNGLHGVIREIMNRVSSNNLMFHPTRSQAEAYVTGTDGHWYAIVYSPSGCYINLVERYNPLTGFFVGV